jgi:hypothetical protein
MMGNFLDGNFFLFIIQVSTGPIGLDFMARIKVDIDLVVLQRVKFLDLISVKTKFSHLENNSGLSLG